MIWFTLPTQVFLFEKGDSMVVRRQKILIDGKELEVPIFDTRITPGEELHGDTLDRLKEEEEVEGLVNQAIAKIETLKKKYQITSQNIDYFYRVGKILQFVDRRNNLRRQRGRVWQRMSRDLAPKLFDSNYKNNNQESRRYPEFMYLLAKVPKKFLKKASFYQWYEIMKFKENIPCPFPSSMKYSVYITHIRPIHPPILMSLDLHIIFLHHFLNTGI